MNSRTVIHVFGWKIAGSLLLAALVAPAWGQQSQQLISSRISHQPKIVTASHTAPSTKADLVAEAVNTLSPPNSEPGTPVKKKAIRKGPLEPMFAPPSEKPNSRAKSSIKMPKLEDPEQFRVADPNTNNKWIKLQDTEPTPELSLANGNQQPQDSEQQDTADETMLRGKLPDTVLRTGILNNPMQRAVFDRSKDLPDTNLSFQYNAVLGPEYASPYQPVTKTWRTPNMFSRPLYFEDANLERYGNGIGVWQPALSGARFFTSVVFLPYKMGAHPPKECDFSMGYYRPGDCNPSYRPPHEFSPRGAVIQGLVVGGLWAGL